MKNVRASMAFAAAVTATLTSAMPAGAGTVVDTCHGTRVWSGALTNDAGRTEGRLEYWTASDGRKCAMVYDLASGAHWMRVQIDKMEEGRALDSAKDEGTYEYYAGGAQVTGDNTRCYQVSALVKYGTDYLRRVHLAGTCP